MSQGWERRILARRLDQTQRASRLRFLTREPDRHAGFQFGRIALRVETQTQRIAIVVADGPLGLPGRERPEGYEF
jgi:hypothetical protein